MRLCCTFFCVSPHTLLSLFYFLLCVSAGTHNHTHKIHSAVDLNASFVAMRRSEEGVRSPSLLFCGCDAPRVTALSWAPCPIEGGMAGNFVAASWMDEGPLARVAGVVIACSVCVVWWPRGFAISLGLWR
ncbi:surface protease GP63 [Trypanosoma cruzi]|nr:surface protease GP63 [Trypanosoma cruzi]